MDFFNVDSQLRTAQGLRCVTRATIVANANISRIDADARRLASDWIAHHPCSNVSSCGHGALAEFPATELMELTFAGGQVPFPPQVARTYRAFTKGVAGQDLCLLYLHRGHSVESKTPILQKLLYLLDHRGPVHALRSQTSEIAAADLAFAAAILVTHRYCLLIHDPNERLGRVETMPTGSRSFTMLLLRRCGEAAEQPAYLALPSNNPLPANRAFPPFQAQGR
jgi:hypothetical protein